MLEYYLPQQNWFLQFVFCMFIFRAVKSKKTNCSLRLRLFVFQVLVGTPTVEFKNTFIVLKNRWNRIFLNQTCFLSFAHPNCHCSLFFSDWCLLHIQLQPYLQIAEQIITIVQTKAADKINWFHRIGFYTFDIFILVIILKTLFNMILNKRRCIFF
jgi:hypothetical protein